MRTRDKGRKVRLSVEVEPELHRRVKIAATERDMTMRDYVIRVLEGVAAEEARAKDSGEVTDPARLSAAAFARDWESEEDSAYDELS